MNRAAELGTSFSSRATSGRVSRRSYEFAPVILASARSFVRPLLVFSVLVAIGCGHRTKEPQTADAAVEPLQGEPLAGPEEQDEEPPFDDMGEPNPQKLQALADVEQAAQNLESDVYLKLVVVPKKPGQNWSFGIVNPTSETFEVVADPRLLSFSVTPRDEKKKPVLCELPEGMRPSTADPEALIVLGPKEAIADFIDPQAYCFEAGAETVLSPGATVKPQFGFNLVTKPRWRGGIREKIPVDPQPPPFVAHALAVEPAESTDEAPAFHRLTNTGVKELVVEPFVLDETYGSWPDDALFMPKADGKRNDGDATVEATAEASGGSQAAASESDDASQDELPAERATAQINPPLSLRLERGSDVSTSSSATVTVSLENTYAEPVWVYFRRELLKFTLLGPHGLRRCDPQPDEREPDRQAFTRLVSGRPFRVVSRLAELCPMGALSHPGVYRLSARFDAQYDGKEAGLNAWSGEVKSENTILVRIRKGDEPETKAPEMLHFELD